ncbi:type 2 isopentenyl-diphosphate Delta-isomerase [Candidatus Dojkabacteria bacterium]|uniref:Isopentenyl-diphosphate delta-isomerase n=1 Tax=Candidatus Dojkabacteria bacterium TaxID=2099670 RepID=A0A955L8P3_9BACT|nr:type 2 isopentenyl-diphosphate Delta-isomerase [Candidatus Dojkabacteria bacterium]
MSQIKKRKKQHIDTVQNHLVEPSDSSFDQVKLPYKALPEINFDNISLASQICGFEVAAPILVASMSGGEQYGKIINTRVAEACEVENIPFGLGSMRIVLEKPESVTTFAVKKLSPSVPMFANLGLVQLNYGVGYDEIMRVIDLVGADGIYFHINHLQEAVQPEGNTNYAGILKKFEKIIPRLKIPFVVKEVGHGIDYESAKKLRNIGVEWIDVAGTGGTSWAWIEGYRRLKENETMNERNLGYIFKEVGISTVDSIRELKKIDGLHIIASGGIRNGLHIAKAIGMGAQVGSLAKPFLHAALDSTEAVISLIQDLKYELKVAMFCAGIKNIEELNNLDIK